MTEEEFVKIRESLKNGGNDLKKLKKETLLEFISILEAKVDTRETEISAELETFESCDKRYKQTLDEYQGLIAEMKTKDDGLREEVKKLVKERMELNDKYKNRISFNYLIIAILVIALIVLISL